MMSKTFIIAEAGVNHCGELDMAIDMVKAAAEARADAVKFQTFKADSLTTPTAPKAEYQKRTTDRNESQQSMLSRLELQDDEYETLFKCCEDYNIEFMSTGFDIESLDFLIQLGISRIKIPSGEITNLPLLNHAARQELPVILSTGMSDMKEVVDAVDSLKRGGLSKNRLTVLHCNTAYPTPFEDVNLSCISAIRERLSVEVGYSDHTLGDEVAIAAVAFGATVIEKHFTLDKKLPGPDQAASLEPKELSQMISRIRHIESSLGDGIKRPSASEMINIEIARKSLVASYHIEKGEVLTEKNVTAKRPASGLSPMEWDSIVGQIAQRDYEKDDLIEK